MTVVILSLLPVSGHVSCEVFLIMRRLNLFTELIVIFAITVENFLGVLKWLKLSTNIFVEHLSETDDLLVCLVYFLRINHQLFSTITIEMKRRMFNQHIFLSHN